MLFDDQLVHVIEGLIFFSPEPIDALELQKLVGVDLAHVEEALQVLEAQYLEGNHGFWLRRTGTGYQFVASNLMRPYLEALFKPHFQKLSKAALEVLSIAAYHQPITKGEIEQIRGVSSDGPLRQLIDRNLIEEAGRKDTPGRPIVYRTTQAFLALFGLEDLTDLPDYDLAQTLHIALSTNDESEMDDASQLEEEALCVES